MAGVVAELQKCSESIWKTAFYSVSLSWGLWLCGSRGWVWLWSFDAAFNHVPDLYRNPDRIDVDIYLFYMFQMAFYVHSIWAHAFGAETKRDDFLQMLLHHFVTLGLLFASFSMRFVAGGTLIVVVHDSADLVFEIAKQLIYTGHETAANIVFGIWVLVWFLTRLLYFPFYIVRGCIWENVARIGWYPTYAFKAITLVVLLALHVFWTTLIVRMIVRMLTGDAKSLRDTRERDSAKSE
jgi:hypothetical protein